LISNNKNTLCTARNLNPHRHPQHDQVTLLNMHSVPYLYYEIIIQFENVGDLTPMKGLPLSDDSSMQADFRLTYVEADYTVFEMKWKTAFLFITILAMFFPRLNRGGSCSSVGCFASFSMIFEGFFAKLCTVPRKQWSYQQRWVGVLLIALFFFNDPLFRYSIYNDSRTSEILSAIYIGWMGAFLCLLMLFWLCALDETASVTNAGGKKLCGSALCQRHVAKFSFMFVYWFWFTTLFIYVRFQQDINPAWSEARSDPRFMPSVAFSAILVTVYDIWFLLYTCKALREIRRMPPPFLFVFVITFFTFAGERAMRASLDEDEKYFTFHYSRLYSHFFCSLAPPPCSIKNAHNLASLGAATCVGMYSGFMYPQVASSTDFLAMTAMYNLYVWTMAFIYAPLSSNGEGGDYGDFDLDVDSSVGVGGGVGGGDGGDGVGTTLQTRGGMEDMQL